MRGIKIKGKNFLNSDTSHITPNPIALTNKVIEVVTSYFCWGVYIIPQPSLRKRLVKRAAGSWSCVVTMTSCPPSSVNFLEMTVPSKTQITRYLTHTPFKKIELMKQLNCFKTNFSGGANINVLREGGRYVVWGNNHLVFKGWHSLKTFISEHFLQYITIISIAS